MVDQPSFRTWLLAVATIAADTLAGVWWITAQAERRQDWHSLAILTSLTLAQIGIVAIWLAFRQVHDVWSFVLPMGALGIAAAIRLKLATFGGFSFVDYACRTAVQMLGTLLGLWLLQHTLWRWLAVRRASRKWEFSVGQLLVWTTMTALFFGLVARSTWSAGELMPLTAMSGVCAPPVIAIGVVINSQHVARWYLRLCAYIVVGSLVAICVAYGRSYILVQLNVEFILEALLIAAWVEWSGIVPWPPDSRIIA
ncbi:MAG TPA: hypothetical protein VH107_13900 [Lacipirellulaceae bacterium]|nr:hypothetical protein [Lacipirellulaceae bacterium]